MQLRDSQSWPTQEGEVRNNNKPHRWAKGEDSLLSACGIHLWAIKWMSNQAQPSLACLNTWHRSGPWTNTNVCAVNSCDPESLDPGHLWTPGRIAEPGGTRRAETSRDAGMGSLPKSHPFSGEGRSAEHLYIRFTTFQPKTKTSFESLEHSWQKNLSRRFFKCGITVPTHIPSVGVKSEKAGKFHSHCNRRCNSTEIRGEMQLLLPAWNAPGMQGICSWMLTQQP